jgi:hypothetical protein
MKRKALWVVSLSAFLCMIVIAAITSTAVFAGVPSTDFDNVLSYNNHLYAITKLSMSWTAAEALAVQYGGHLVAVNDSAESDFLSLNFGGYGSPWIGLFKEEGTGWLWTNGMIQPGYTNWADSEPSGGDEYCVMTNWESPGKWNDGNCTNVRHAIVEWKSVSGTVTLPKTGQTKCYNQAGTEIACAGTGQDADVNSGVPWPQPRFSSTHADCVKDNLTGLKWPKNGDLAKKNWQEALDFVAALNAEGLCDHYYWRLPSVNELQSLTYPGGDIQMYTWLNTQGFTGMRQGDYWSSTTGAYNTSFAAKVTMTADGQMSHNNKADQNYVLPVQQPFITPTIPARVPRTGQTTSYSANDDGDLESGIIWPTPRFTPSSECIIDNLTGLIWTKNGNSKGEQVNWQGALDYAAAQNESERCGRTDWRLPNLYEMKSLINHEQVSTATWLNGTAQGFNSVQHSFYWTSSNYSANAWTLYLGGGTSGFFVKSLTDFFVWPVSGRICYQNLARLSDVDYYSTIQEAYDNAYPDDILETRASVYCEDLYFDEDIAVHLKGGLDQGFGSQTGYTTVYGLIAVISGTVTVENIIIL